LVVEPVEDPLVCRVGHADHPLSAPYSRIGSTPDAATAEVLGAGPDPISGLVLSLGGIRTTALQQRSEAGTLLGA
jgi:hypothetical protein